MTRIYFIQKWLLIILLFGSALAFNPWITTEVFEFPKLLVLLFSVSLLGVSIIFDLYFHTFPKINIKEHIPEIIGFSGLFLSQILAYIFSTNWEISLMGAPDRYQGFLTQIHYLLLFFCSFYFFIRYPQEKTKKLFSWLIITLLFVLILALSPYAFPLTAPFYIFTPDFFYNRIYGTFGNPNYLAIFIAALLPFVFFRQYKRNTIVNICLQIFKIFTLFALFLTGSRSAWLAALIGFFIIGIIEINNKNHKTIIYTALTAFGIVLLFIIKQQFTAEIPQLNRLSFDTNKSTSIQTRATLWKIGLKMSLDRPITGYGQDMIQANIEPYLPQHLKANEIFFIDRTHSEFTDILLTSGYVGLISYLILLITIVIKSTKLLLIKNSTNFTSALTSFSILIIFHAVNFSTVNSNILLYFFAGYLMANYMLKFSSQNNKLRDMLKNRNIQFQAR